MMGFIVNWLAAIPGLACPYALAALGLIVSERAGVLTLTAEGLMLVGALAGVVAFNFFGGHPLGALGVSMFAAALTSGLFAVLVVLLRVNQVLAGLAMVFFCQGLTNLIGARAEIINVPIAGMDKVVFQNLTDVPFIGPIVFHQDLVVYALIPIFALVTTVLQRTWFGLRLRAVGESSQAADAAGVNVSLYRAVAIVAGATLIGLAGGYLSVVNSKLWAQEMTAGRGWIAVALVVFARWRPWGALAGALLFGGIEALVPRLAAQGFALPQYVILMTPYIATLVVMTWFAIAGLGVLGGPEDLGVPHIREERR
jgi:general nucleoside transport system permease protein